MKGFAKYYGKKILWYLVTLVFAVLLNFLLPRLMPGDPVQQLISNAASGVTDQNAYQKVVEKYTQEFGLDKPLYSQFFIYIQNLFRGNLGISFAQYPKSVSSIIGESVVWTLALQIPAMVVGWILGNVLGAIAAYIRKGFDKVVLPAFMFISNMPAFGLALILVSYVAVKWAWFPVGGGYGFDMVPNLSWSFIGSVLYHYQLPFWTMVFITIGGQAIGMRSMAIYELNTDYVKYSRFLGIKDRKIVGYVFRNSMLPQITGLALSIGSSVGGNLVAESIYSYPGLGSQLLKAISARDYPTLSACTLIITIMVLIANLVVEMLYAVVDPRIKAAQQDS
ncbi:MAG: ABC transporter permease [Acutalibacter sp.]|nr:ABC transporter permease [Acutalibacter sp.]